MSPWAEIDGAVERVRARTDAPLAILQCTSAYPTAPEDLGLNLVGELRERYGCAAGLSDHSGTIFPSLAATALGGRVVEVHVALSRHKFGPDLAAGAVLAEEDLAVKKPGGELPPRRLAELVGRRLEAPVAVDEPLSERHVGQ